MSNAVEPTHTNCNARFFQSHDVETTRLAWHVSTEVLSN